jgi:hypothetical protein
MKRSRSDLQSASESSFDSHNKAKKRKSKNPKNKELKNTSTESQQQCVGSEQSDKEQRIVSPKAAKRVQQLREVTKAQRIATWNAERQKAQSIRFGSPSEQSEFWYSLFSTTLSNLERMPGAEAFVDLSKRTAAQRRPSDLASFLQEILTSIRADERAKHEPGEPSILVRRLSGFELASFARWVRGVAGP